MLVNDEYYMQQALREAEKAFEQDEIPIGAIIVIHQKVVARAYNMTEQLNDSTAHAEIMRVILGITLVGTIILSKPAFVLFFIRHLAIFL